MNWRNYWLDDSGSIFEEKSHEHEGEPSGIAKCFCIVKRNGKKGKHAKIISFEIQEYQAQKD